MIPVSELLSIKDDWLGIANNVKVCFKRRKSKNNEFTGFVTAERDPTALLLTGDRSKLTTCVGVAGPYFSLAMHSSQETKPKQHVTSGASPLTARR